MMGHLKSKKHILVISQDVVGANMAGPGIRYYNLALVLSRDFEVVLAVPCEPDPDFFADNLRLVKYYRSNWHSIEHFVNGANVILINGILAGEFPQLAEFDIPLVIDGYNPILPEWLTATQTMPNDQVVNWGTLMQQRLGLLEANGRINPWNLREDPSLRSLIDVVPFGIPETQPRHTQNVIRSVWTGISQTDRILLWGGGLWPWLDPLTAVRALGSIWQTRQDVRLIFPGTKHPNPSMAQMPTHLEATRREAAKLGLLNKAIFFGDWIANKDWPNVLIESDIALALHYEDLLETRLAFRTRVLDYTWAGLPMVATRGDATSEIIRNYSLGELVSTGDVEGVTEAILRILDSPRQEYQQRFEKARKSLTWTQVARPLLAFCKKPRLAADKSVQGNEVGNPYYVFENQRLTEENAQLRNLVQAYENRRSVRLLNRLHHLLYRRD
jgi:glycosyltransferase involved in cell wall biosynthesis